MSSSFQSFQSYTGPTEGVPQDLRGDYRGAVTTPAAGTTSRVIVRDGVMTSTHAGVSSTNSAALNPQHENGTVFATARPAPGKMAVQSITGDTLITIGGVQSSVAFFESQGLVHRTADGSYAEGSGQPQEAPVEAPAADTSNDLNMPDWVAAEVDQALDGVPDHDIHHLVGLGVGVATGELDRAALERRISQASGASPEEAAARVSTMQAAYSLQANAAVTGRTGIAEADLADFWSFAKAQHPGELKGAVNAQIHRNSFEGYRALAERYLASVPPTLQAVQAAGLQTRQDGKEAEVFLSGRWMTLTNAAKLGML